MTDYAKDLLGGGTPQKATGTDYASDLLGIKREWTPDPGVIDTRTAKPRVNWTPTGEPRTGFGTLVKSGFVDDPQTKIKIFAKGRGIPEDRYRVTSGGEIVYQGDDGNWYPETKQTVGGKLVRVVGEAAAQTPAAVLGAAGSTFGPAGAAVGAAGGEGIRKVVGATVFDEPQTVKGNVAGMATEAALGFTGEVGGRLVAGGINRAGSKRGGQLVAAAGRDRRFLNPAQVAANEAKGQKFGVDLLPPQTTGSRELIGKTKWLRDRPGTADVISEALQRQNQQAQAAAEEFIRDLGGYQSPKVTGTKLVSAAGKALAATVEARKKIAGPVYKKAFEADVKVDVEPLLKHITDAKKTAKGDILAGLNRAEKLLKAPDLPNTTPASKILDASGNPAIPASVSYDTTLKGLHGARVTLWDMIDTANRKGQGNLAGELKGIWARLTDQMDKASPDYKKARGLYEAATGVGKVGERSLVSDIAGLEGDAVVNAHKKLIQNTFTHPDTVRVARARIEKQDPEAWKNTVGIFLLDKFNKAKTGDVMNFGGKLHNAIVRDENTRKVLEAAMDPKDFANLMDLADVLNKASLLAGKESATAERLLIDESIRSQTGSKVGRLLQTDVTAPLKKIGQWLDGVATEKDARKLADAIVSEKAAIQLQRMRQLQPGTEKWIRQLGTVASILAGGAASRELGREPGRLTEEGQEPARLRPPRR